MKPVSGGSESGGEGLSLDEAVNDVQKRPWLTRGAFPAFVNGMV
jgi:hypothetical protein